MKRLDTQPCHRLEVPAGFETENRASTRPADSLWQESLFSERFLLGSLIDDTNPDNRQPRHSARQAHVLGCDHAMIPETNGIQLRRDGG